MALYSIQAMTNTSATKYISAIIIYGCLETRVSSLRSMRPFVEEKPVLTAKAQVLGFMRSN